MEGGAKVRVICGRINGTRGPVRDIVTDPEYLDVVRPDGGDVPPPGQAGATRSSPTSSRARPTSTRAAIRTPARRRGGTISTWSESACAGRSPSSSSATATPISINAEKEPVRFLLVSGKPIGEPVAWYGPIVMNTEEELRIAFEEYRKGTFIKHR